MFFCAISVTDKIGNYQGNNFLVPHNSLMLAMPRDLNCEFHSMSAIMLYEHILYKRHCSFNTFFPRPHYEWNYSLFIFVGSVWGLYLARAY